MDWENINYIDIEQLSEIDRQFLVERQLISREWPRPTAAVLLRSTPPSGTA